MEGGLTKKDAAQALETVLGGIASTLKEGKSVQLLGFGSFNIQKRAERNGVNPATGAKLVIPAKNVIKFKAGSALSDSVNQ